MGKGKQTQTPKLVGNDLEPYRRLIEIQKEVAKMAKQHEQSRRECDALRERVAREAMASLRGKGGVRFRLRLSTFKLFKRLPRLAATEFLRVLNHKQSSSC